MNTAVEHTGGQRQVFTISNNSIHFSGERRPSIDDILMNRAGYISAHGFAEGITGMLKFLSDYPAQLKLLYEVFPRSQIHVIDGEKMVTVP